MMLSSLHASILSRAIERVLGSAYSGSMAYVRCLTGEIVEALARASDFQLKDWQVWRIADVESETDRTITADLAVEIRESKSDPALLLVDTALAGAGMDGIYSAAREIHEKELFSEAIKLAAHEVTQRLSRGHRMFAEQAVKKARRSRRANISPWVEFDFYATTAAENKSPGAFLHLIGLWPVQEEDRGPDPADLEISLLFVNLLMGSAVAAATPAARIEMLRLLNPSQDQIRALESFLRSVAAKPLFPGLAELATQPNLWVNSIKIESAASIIQGIELLPWRTRTGRLAAWIGLIEENEPDTPPVFIIRPDAQQTGRYSKLEIRWKSRPEQLDKGSAVYRVAVITDMEEELASREVPHSGGKEEKCRFTNDDFTALSEDALIPAKMVVSVIGNEGITPEESDEFLIRVGEPPDQERGGVGKNVRTFSEGLIELGEREPDTSLISSAKVLTENSKGFVLLRTPQKGKSFRVFRPALIREVEALWLDRNGEIGRWQVKVRASGIRAGSAEFTPFIKPKTIASSLWDRAERASRRMAERFGSGGGVAQIYDERSKGTDAVIEYLLAWSALIESQDFDPILALVNTVEVQSLGGRTIGLIVLPNHPLRVAWHMAYDNLVFHARFDQGLTPKEVRDEVRMFDGSMFPAFLPGLDQENTFIFGDTLGFHSTGMVLDRDEEPKASIALLARALGESETAESAPTVGRQSAEVLGSEIIKYLECHGATRLLQVHALRPGDGFTVARSLGYVHNHFHKDESFEEGEEEGAGAPVFVLELYPSEAQRGISGRFIAEMCEKRRSGTGISSPVDQWMLESLPLEGGINLARLRWARKESQSPEKAAHIAAAFDTFDFHVAPAQESETSSKRPLYGFGLLSFFERRYQSLPIPYWMSFVNPMSEGEKHPSDRAHTERLVRINQAIMKAVAKNLGGSGLPILRTEISAEKADDLRTLHSLCDWVITVDRNAGIEYFDSPRDNKDIYDAYVIDCVPEREDLGCLQLITSTANLEEVRNLLDHALDQMALSHSRKNAEFLLANLKALSGRLAIRLTGRKAVTSELIALAILHANCRMAPEESESLVSLDRGFFVPVDDVRDLLPPVSEAQGHAKSARPDLIHVSLGPRKGLLFRFVEVKYRRHLRAARNPEELNHVRQQVKSLRSRWDEWYLSPDLPSVSRALRRAKLARVLRFYADKARRHYLSELNYQDLASEIDRMIANGGSYTFANTARCDRGYIFCPEYNGAEPLEITPGDWETRVFLFGPGLLPDSTWQTLTNNAENVAYSEAIGQNTPVEEEQRGEVLLRNLAEGDLGQMDPDRQRSSVLGPRVCLGDDLLSNTEVSWSPTIKGNPHLMVIGLPGMGKTTCLINICRQTLQSGVKPIVFSYHEDIDQRLDEIVGPVRFVDFHGLGFNPLQVLDRESRHGYLDVAGALRDILVAIFPELGDVQGERVRQAIKQSFVEIGWGNPDSDNHALREPDFKRFLEILRETPKPDRGLKTLLARLEELEDYGFFELGHQQENLWQSEHPVIVRIHTTQNDTLQRAFASLIFYGLYKDMFRRGTQDHLTHTVIFDEAHRAASLKLIPTMAKECRKYGISLVLASQEARDFHVSLYSAIANYLVLRLTDVDAKALVRNVASSDQERGLIDRIKQLDRFKALYFSEGRRKPAYVALSS